MPDDSSPSSWRVPLTILLALGLTSDPNPNPVGLGLLFLAGAFIGTILVIVGIIAVASRGR